MPIDSITVRVTDGLKTGEYAPNKVYDLTAIISNPGDGDVDRAITLLSGAGERFLGRAPATAAPAAPAAPEAPRRGRPPKNAAPPPAEMPANPAAIEDEGDAGHLEHSDVEPKSNPADLSDVLGAEEPAAPEITDAELTSATTRKNGELANPAAVRALIQTFKPADAGDRVMRLVEIPQERRREYLDKLAALAKS